MWWVRWRVAEGILADVRLEVLISVRWILGVLILVGRRRSSRRRSVVVRSHIACGVVSLSTSSKKRHDADCRDVRVKERDMTEQKGTSVKEDMRESTSTLRTKKSGGFAVRLRRLV